MEIVLLDDVQPRSHAQRGNEVDEIERQEVA